MPPLQKPEQQSALVVQAYMDTHHGKAPAPALVKRLITSTAAGPLTADRTR